MPARLPLPGRVAYALVGAALAIGAPLGLLGIRLVGSGGADPDAVRRELRADRATYVYVTVSTVLAFASFGWILGRQADALLVLSRTDALTGLGNKLAF